MDCSRDAHCAIPFADDLFSARTEKVSGGHGGGDTPVPIPNTEVKLARADGTWGETPWESRSPPEYFSKTPSTSCWGFLCLYPGICPFPPHRGGSSGPSRTSS